MKKAIVLMMAMLMLLTACAGDGGAVVTTENSQNNNQPTEEVTVDIAPQIPDEILPEEMTEFRIFTQGWYGHTPLDIVDIGIEEDSDDVVVHAAFTRDLIIEEKMNVSVINVSHPECYGSYNDLANEMLAGCPYDLLILRSAVFTTAVQNDLLMDLGSPDLTYFDPSKPYWDEKAYESMAMFGKHFGVVGDFSVSDDLTLFALFFNKDMRTAYGFDNPYDLVKSGEWTYEAMYNMAKDAAGQLNDDDVMTYEDRWGITYLRDTVSGMINSVGIQFGEADEDGLPYISFYTQANVDKVLKIFDYLYDTDTCYNIHARGGDEVKVFTDGRALFTFGGIYYAPQMRLAETGVEFGILPYPKYNTEQEDYISSISPLFLTVLCNSKNCISEDLALKSAVMEEYAYYGHEKVLPAFYGILLMGRIAKDVETQEILDFIFGNVAYDIVNIFNFGDLPFFVIDMTMTSNRDIASVYQKYIARAEGQISKLIQKYD